MESSGGKNQNGGVNEKRKHERDRGINGGELDRLGFAGGALFIFAGLDNGRMQVKVVRHHGRAENADGDQEHLPVAKDF